MDVTSEKQLVLGTIAPLSGVPTLPAAFVRSIFAMHDWNLRVLLAGTDQTIQWSWATCYAYHLALNAACENAVGDWVLLLDTDMVFPPDLVGHFLRAQADVRAAGGHPDVVTAVYHDRRAPFGPLIYQEPGGGRFDLFPEDAPFRVGAAGSGCLWVSRDALGRIYQELRERPFDPTETVELQGLTTALGPEVAFFKRCARLDLQVWADPRIPVGHLMELEIGREHYLHARARTNG